MTYRAALCHVFTVPDSLSFIRGQTTYMQERGFDVFVIASPGPPLERFRLEQNVHAYPVSMSRRISPVKDMHALWKLVREIRRIRPDIVHSHTPKGGLLGMIAATILQIPVRIYHIRGLPYMTASGPKRLLMKSTEWVSCRLAHQVICVSHSIREVAIQDGVCPRNKVKTYQRGSGNGVDAVGKFNPDRFDESFRCRLRRSLGIGESELVIGFVGRIFREKGVEELAEAWSSVRLKYPDAHLVLVGEEQEVDRISDRTMSHLRKDPRVHFTGAVDDTAVMYSIFDVLVLPTYREGLPNVLLEAAAMELPVVATNVPGCIDAVRDGGTGTLVRVGDAQSLDASIQRYLESGGLRREHGRAGRKLVLEEFSQEAIWQSIYEEYVFNLARARL